MNSKLIISFFKFSCIISTLVLLSMCAWRYVQNYSTSLIDFRTYLEREEDIYPSFSFCFREDAIYNREKINASGIEKYRGFLEGKMWDEEMRKIDYDEITMDLKDYVKSVSALHKYGGSSHYSWIHNDYHESKDMLKSSELKPNFPFYTSFRHGSMKCFSLDISDKNMPGVLKYTTEVLIIEWKNVNLLSSSMPGYFMHYPGQLFRASPLVAEYIPNQGFFTGLLSAKNFWIDSVEVLKRRNTLKSECLEDSEKDQEYIISKLFEKTQCKPPNWKDAKYPTCNSKISMAKSYVHSMFFGDAKFLNKTIRPCNQLKTIVFQTQDIPMVKEDINVHSNHTMFIIFKGTTYKEILHIRSFDIESLVGNMGGYIGLFLGFAIWQVPDGIKAMLAMIKHGGKK